MDFHCGVLRVSFNQEDISFPRFNLTHDGTRGKKITVYHRGGDEGGAGSLSLALGDSLPRIFNLGLIIILTKPLKNVPNAQGRGENEFMI